MNKKSLQRIEALEKIMEFFYFYDLTKIKN